MTKHAWRAAVVAAFLLAAANAASAQDPRQNEAGQFDFYVLSLSWSPSFCEAAGERAPQQQCGVRGEDGPRPSSFVVHGLWPQYDNGFPEYCQQPAPRLDRNIVSSMLDLMPAPRLIFRQWDRHGTCSGLSARAYFDTVRKARAAVKIPADYLDLKTPIAVTPAQVEEAFIAANPGMTREGVVVSCDGTRLREIRICLSRDLNLRDCGGLERRACRREKVAMPPVRGG
jgi:ribonuclease T2